MKFCKIVILHLSITSHVILYKSTLLSLFFNNNYFSEKKVEIHFLKIMFRLFFSPKYIFNFNLEIGIYSLFSISVVQILRGIIMETIIEQKKNAEIC